jgi:LacI family transcriptional regulator
MEIEIQPELTVQLKQDMSSPELGSSEIRNLLATKQFFTALVCFNDVAAIGAIRAIRDQGLRVPDDISVIGFDDIKAAAYMSPALTTIRQPMEEMGRAAAQFIINRLNRTEDFRESILFEPELVIRESTSQLVIRESTSQLVKKAGLRHSKAEPAVRASKRRPSGK